MKAIPVDILYRVVRQIPKKEKEVNDAPVSRENIPH